MSSTLPDDIANCVLAAFEALPPKFKPRERAQGKREWVPLSGIVLSSELEPLTCVALATGMKCLPRDKMQMANGTTLHDWHAEVLTIRAFNRFLIDECLNVADGNSSPWIMRSPDAELQPFTIKDDIRIHMYCSECPCGDASMELIMNEQEDATPWTYLSPVVPEETNVIPLHGRGYFSELGIVRTKPSRPDAPVTLSKSCTDKLALKQCTSLLNSIASLLIAPRQAYLNSLVIPESQYVPTAIERAFGLNGRMKSITPQITCEWTEAYGYKPFNVITTSREFQFSKRAACPGNDRIASNLSAVWTPYFEEVLIGGVQQGRKQFDSIGGSRTCRKSLWKAVVNVLDKAEEVPHFEAKAEMNYANAKANSALDCRRKVKEDVRRYVLKGWARNAGDDSFGL
ncbi:adenosine-deaminase domain-containing protein [Rhizodiscina lignyota]|uniref:Adenosine-deaminase domain-containing protein n=1 Tax=Rhizodiscina lignyota TaxID=1504668 RepID=A0A9P4M869_9PEZI|nr:adenosine-deaminase domain-containing protein [Rhizodiscina lignyota]